VNSREQGQIRARDIEVALGRLAPSRAADPSTSKSIGQLHAQIGAAFSSDRSVPSAAREAYDHAVALQALLNERIGASRALDLAPLVQPLGCLVEACDTAIRTYPNTNSISDAYYRMGLALKSLKQMDRAREAFEYVVKTYPDSNAATLAQQALAQLGARQN